MKWLLLFLPFCLCSSEFSHLMGEETSHWFHVSRSEDVRTLEQLEAFYEMHKGFRFNKAGNYRIPKVIHVIALGPPMSEAAVMNLKTWVDKHPDWTVKVWSDCDRLFPFPGVHLCVANAFPFLFLGPTFQTANDVQRKADLLRFEILYQEGGVLIDPTSKCLSSFDGFNRGYDFFAGLEPPHPPVSGRNITTSPGIVGARPFHPVIGKVLELKRKEVEEPNMHLTLALDERLGEDGNRDIVFPAAYFFATSGLPALYAQPSDAGLGADKKDGRIEHAFLAPRKEIAKKIGKGAIYAAAVAFTVLFFYVRKRRRMG